MPGAVPVAATRRLSGPLPRHLAPNILLTGDALLLLAFSAVVALHFYMGENWSADTRIDDRTHLITKEPFAVSRNPMMLGVVTAQVALFLTLPSLFTLICLTLAVWAVAAQVGVEEHLLQQRHGEKYTDYAAHTPRWLTISYRPGKPVSPVFGRDP